MITVQKTSRVNIIVPYHKLPNPLCLFNNLFQLCKMSTSLPESANSLTDTTDFSDLTLAWLGTAAAQIFVMQLGFLAFESGSVHPVWSQSIIIKNIEDTFVVCLPKKTLKNIIER